MFILNCAEMYSNEINSAPRITTGARITRKRKSKSCVCLSCCILSGKNDSDRLDLLGHDAITNQSTVPSSNPSCRLFTYLRKIKRFFTKLTSFSSKKFNNNFVVMSRCHAQQQGSVQVQVPPSQFVRARSSRGGSSRHGSGNESNISDGLRNELIRPCPQRRANRPDLNRLQNRQVGPVQGLFIFISSIVVLMFYGRTNAVQYACLCLSLFFTKTRQVTGTSR